MLGTQNPIEQEGTYPLPEAQLDRFMFKILIRYPTFAEELKIAEQTTVARSHGFEPVLTREEILDYQRVTRNILVSPSNIEYAVRLVRATRPAQKKPRRLWVSISTLAWGAGPRAYQALLLGAKANALLDGRVHVSSKDIRAVSKPVLRHRLVTSFAAESDGKDVDSVIADLIKSIPEPDSDV